MYLIYTCRVIAGLLLGDTSITSCHSAVLSKQQLTETPKYDGYDDFSIRTCNDELASSLNTL